MNAFQNDRHWGKPTHWTLGVLYRAPSDPRWFVPLRATSGGWTVNVAHRGAIASAIAIATIAIAPAAIAAVAGRLPNPYVAGASLLWFLACVIPIGAYVRSRSV